MKPECKLTISPGYLFVTFMFLVLMVFPLKGLSQDFRPTEEKLMKEAEENIEKFRKGDVSIQFKSRDGKRRVFLVHVSRNEENKWVFTID